MYRHEITDAIWSRGTLSELSSLLAELEIVHAYENGLPDISLDTYYNSISQLAHLSNKLGLFHSEFFYLERKEELMKDHGYTH